MSRQYNRSFITLTQERGDYALPSKQSLGKCIIESRGGGGKLSIYAQDIKPKILYKVYLIAGGAHESKGLPLGNLTLDEKGKGELKWEFDADDVGGTGLPIEKFNTVAVVVTRGTEMLTVLSGFAAEEILWKNNFTDLSVKESKAKEIRPQKNDRSEQKVSEQKVHTAKDNNEAQDLKEVKKPIETENLNKAEDVKKAEDTNKTEPSPKQKKENERIYSNSNDFFVQAADLITAHEVFKKVIEDFDKKVEKLSGADYVFANHAQMNPFPDEDNDDNGINWVRITLKDLILFGEKGYEYMTHPFVVQSYQKYKHLMVGERIGAQKQYIIAVPDVYNPTCKTMAEELGFNEFKSNGSKHGYWLCKS